MATAKERDQFIAVMVREFPDKPLEQVTRIARLLLRHARTHGNIAVMECNGHPAQGSPTLDIKTINRLQEQHDAWCEKRSQQIERRITEIAKELDLVVQFGGDPRGFTVKLMLPSERYNSFGGKENGWGVPS